MSRTSILGDLDLRCVEPVKRMVGGRYGWAVHRFPIKGGLPRRVLFDGWSRALARTIERPSYFASLMKGKDAPIQPVGQIAIADLQRTSA